MRGPRHSAARCAPCSRASATACPDRAPPCAPAARIQTPMPPSLRRALEQPVAVALVQHGIHEARIDQADRGNRQFRSHCGRQILAYQRLGPSGVCEQRTEQRIMRRGRWQIGHRAPAKIPRPTRIRPAPPTGSAALRVPAFIPAVVEHRRRDPATMVAPRSCRGIALGLGQSKAEPGMGRGELPVLPDRGVVVRHGLVKVTSRSERLGDGVEGHGILGIEIPNLCERRGGLVVASAGRGVTAVVLSCCAPHPRCGAHLGGSARA